jgi:two-component system OmpR family response regulator
VIGREEEIRDLVATAVRFRGFSVAQVGSGGEAFGLAGSANPHLMMLDVMPPDLEGVTLCDKKRA